MPKTLNISLETPRSGRIYPAASELPDCWKRPAEIANHRFKLGVMNRGYTLHGVRNDKVAAEVAIGRDWAANYPGTMRFEVGLPWGDAKLALLPAFAGLGDEVLDRTAISALSSMPYAFANARATDFSVSARHAVRQLSHRNFNPVRLLWRLAAMWLGATIAEEQGGDLEVTALKHAREPRWIIGTNDLNVMLVEAASGHEQTLFVDIGQEEGRPTKLLEVLLTATAGQVAWRDRTGRPLPSLLSHWPDINNCVLNVYGGVQVPIEPGSMSAITIWEAAATYVQQHGIQDIWSEVLSGVAVHALRPAGDSVWVGHVEAATHLPRSELSADGLGPLSQPMRAWVYASRAISYPDTAVLLWEGTARYAAYSVALSMAAAEMGAETLAFDKTPARQQALLELQGLPQLNYVPLNHVANNILSSLGWSEAFGRIFLTTYGKTRSCTGRNRASRMLTYLLSEHTVQWEEVLPYLSHLPNTAAIYPTLFPVSADITYPIKRWLTCSVISGRSGTADAFYSVAAVAGNQLGYARVAQSGVAAEYVSYTMLQNYRGAGRDHQFYIHNVGDDVQYIPVFQSLTASAVLSTHLRSVHDKDIRWYFTEDRSTTFMGVLAEFGYPATPRSRHVTDPITEMLMGGEGGADHARTTPGVAQIPAQTAVAPDLTASGEQPAGVGRRADDPSPDLSGREPLPQTSGVSRADLRIETQADKLQELLGGQDPYGLIAQVRGCHSVRQGGPHASKPPYWNPMALSSSAAKLDPVEVAAVLDPPDRAQGMRLLANLLTEGAALMPTGNDAQAALVKANATRQLASNMAVSPILTAEEFTAATGRTVAEAVQPMITRGLKAGLSLAEIVLSEDTAQLEGIIAQNERLLEAAVAEATNPPDATCQPTYVEAGQSGSVAEEPGADERQTPVEGPGFGGAVLSQAQLGTAPSPPASSVESVLQTSALPGGIAFTGTTLVDSNSPQ
jgi:hypothetical protein